MLSAVRKASREPFGGCKKPDFTPENRSWTTRRPSGRRRSNPKTAIFSPFPAVNPSVIAVCCRRPQRRSGALRRRKIDRLRSRIEEIGSGSITNVCFWPEAALGKSPLAIEESHLFRNVPGPPLQASPCWGQCWGQPKSGFRALISRINDLGGPWGGGYPDQFQRISSSSRLAECEQRSPALPGFFVGHSAPFFPTGCPYASFCFRSFSFHSPRVGDVLCRIVRQCIRADGTCR